MQLRYIIIPLLILLYLFWNYKSIKEIVDDYHKNTIEPEFSEFTKCYIFHIVLLITILVGWGIIELIKLIYKYW